MTTTDSTPESKIIGKKIFRQSDKINSLFDSSKITSIPNITNVYTKRDNRKDLILLKKLINRIKENLKKNKNYQNIPSTEKNESIPENKEIEDKKQEEKVDDEDEIIDINKM